ncbi:MAG: right-handed parallel beta-helix repeat-containing protein [Candidatus Bipolaricaulota bacterium]|nr:right-handed parallel beta-helix repeat-containing protein [Candidatus Bipolaricaulota bacterium]
MAYRGLVALFALLVATAWAAGAREIRVPEDALLRGNVLVAEAFSHVEGNETVSLDYQVWPGDNGLMPATWFDTCVEAHPGDVLVLAPGDYDAEIWIFTPGLTMRTEVGASRLALIRGTVEVDADVVTLESLGVTSSSVSGTSGHGIEVNRQWVRTITIRDCSSSQNRWTGIHIVGARGVINEMRVERCILQDNGMDGVDSTSMHHLVVIGCTVTGNGRGLATGVGIRIGHNVDDVQLEDNVVANNRYADVYRAAE